MFCFSLSLMLLFTCLTTFVLSLENKAECDDFEQCGACTRAPECVWCLATLSCYHNSTVNMQCPFTQRTNCCNTFTTCQECSRDAGCGWCTNVGCRVGTANGDTEDYCPASEWTYEGANCRLENHNSVGSSRVLLGVAMVVGIFAVLLGGVLLALFTARTFQRSKAREALSKYAKAVRKHALQCDRCAVASAAFECHTCMAFFCARCFERQHAALSTPPHRSNRLQRADSPNDTNPAAASYTSFAPLLATMDGEAGGVLAEELGLS